MSKNLEALFNKVYFLYTHLYKKHISYIFNYNKRIFCLLIYIV